MKFFSLSQFTYNAQIDGTTILGGSLTIKDNSDVSSIVLDPDAYSIILTNSSASTTITLAGSTGTVTATTLVGAGSGITALNMGNAGSGTLAVGRGGTGVTTFGGTNTLLYTSSADTLTSLTTQNSRVLITDGSGAISWGTTLPAVSGVNLTALNMGNAGSGTLVVGRGGTGTTTAPTSGGVIYAASTSAYASTALGTTSQVLIGGSAPTWSGSPTLAGSNITSLNADNVSAGTLSVGRGGTGTTNTPNQGGIVYCASSSAYDYTSAGTSGQILQSNGTSAPTWTTLDLSLIPTSTFKKSVIAATTANITLSGTQTIDGISVIATNRVLVKNQSTPASNGIYACAAGSWSRVTDFDSASEAASAIVTVDSGTTNGGKKFTTNFKSTDTLGTTAMNWYELLDDANTATLTNKTWNGVTIGVGYGGTGVTTFGGTNTLLYTSSTNTLTSLTTQNSRVLITDGSGVPSWGTTLPAVSGANLTSLNGSNISTGTVGTGVGGTGLTTYTANGVFYASSTSVMAQDAGMTYNASTDVLTLAGGLFVGPASGTATATPVYVDMGGTYGTNTAGTTGNLKFLLYSAGAKYGIGMSANRMEFQAPVSSFHTFYVNGVSTFEIAGTGVTFTGTSLTGSSATTLANFSQTWNTTGTPTAVKVAVTNTASNASSKLIDILSGASGTTSRFSVSVGGVTTAQSISTTAVSSGTNDIAIDGNNFLAQFNTAFSEAIFELNDADYSTVFSCGSGTISVQHILQCNNSVSFVASGIGTTSTDIAGLYNNTLATVGAQVQMSPALRFRGNAWKSAATAASQTQDFFIEMLPIAGVSSTSAQFRFAYSNNGGSKTFPYTFSAAGNFVALGTMTGTELYCTNVRILGFDRTIPTTVGNGVDIGAYTVTNGGSNMEMWVTVASTGYATSKRYFFPTAYNGTNNTWKKLEPISSTGPYSGQDADLEININNAVVSLRLRRTSGTTAGTAKITMMFQGYNADTFTPSTSTGSVTAPTTRYEVFAEAFLSTIVQIGTSVTGTEGSFSIQNWNSSSQKIRFFSMTPTNNGGASPAATFPAIVLARAGVYGVAYDNYAEIKIGRYEHATTNARTVLDFALTHGNGDAAGTNVLSLYSSKRAVVAGGLSAGVFALTDGASIATDANNGNLFTVTLGGNRTMSAPTNPTSGQVIRYRLKQDGTGTRLITWDTGTGGFRFSGGTAPTLTTTINKIDYVTFIYNAADNKWDFQYATLNL